MIAVVQSPPLIMYWSAMDGAHPLPEHWYNLTHRAVVFVAV